MAKITQLGFNPRLFEKLQVFPFQLSTFNLKALGLTENALLERAVEAVKKVHEVSCPDEKLSVMKKIPEFVAASIDALKHKEVITMYVFNLKYPYPR